MRKLALIGKGISHTKSPEMYRKIFKSPVDYYVLDFESTEKIPSAVSLLKSFEGISITSPYKEHFLDEVKLDSHTQKLGAINCLFQKDSEVHGANTDYLAIVDILKKDLQSRDLEIIVLGDGVMSRVLQTALQELAISYKVYSRKNDPLFFKRDFSREFNKANCSMIINTCAREYVFKSPISSETIFWDFNYQFAPHEHLKGQCFYRDGLEMLYRQALYATVIWSSN